MTRDNILPIALAIGATVLALAAPEEHPKGGGGTVGVIGHVTMLDKGEHSIVLAKSKYKITYDGDTKIISHGRASAMEDLKEGEKVSVTGVFTDNGKKTVRAHRIEVMNSTEQ